MNIQIVDWQADSAGCRAIRQQVFIVEQGVSVDDEWDTHDSNATHFLVCAPNETCWPPLGYCLAAKLAAWQLSVKQEAKVLAAG